MSGGERRFLRVAASIGNDIVDVSLGDVVAGLDRYYVDLILAGIAHAAGTHEGAPTIFDRQTMTVAFGDPYTSLHPWPTTPEKR